MWAYKFRGRFVQKVTGPLALLFTLNKWETDIVFDFRLRVDQLLVGGWLVKG